MSFFEATPSGRLLSRFGQDVGLIDEMLTMLTDATISFIFTLSVLGIIISWICPPMIVVLFVSTVAFLTQVQVQDATLREVKRMSNNGLSPVLNCLGETGDARGKLLVRVMGFGGRYCARFDKALDECNRYHFVALSITSLGVTLSYWIALSIAAATSYIVVFSQTVHAADLGLAMTYSLMLPYFLQVFSQILSMLKVAVTSLERLLQCSSDAVPQEPPWRLESDTALEKQEWPTAGGISFKDATLVYRPGLPPALDTCSFDISGGKKIGVVGRTGAGKSSLSVLLFRLVDAAGGRVEVDGNDIAKVGLVTLRRQMAIIPQEPMMLEGTVLTNIDPFGEQSSEKVKEVLRLVGLEGCEESNPESLSAGERQLIQLARTLLRDVRIVVMDEPTSNIDPETDGKIQSIVREQFKQCTVITIAHRLDTVIDSNYVLVMDKGKVAEFDTPHNLIEKGEIFSSMLCSLGSVRHAELVRRARVAHFGETAAGETAGDDIAKRVW
jgi:ATP-binding cassette subfamily C (CFTR/MRP) protein 1